MSNHLFPSASLVLHFWKQTVREKLLLLQPALGSSPICAGGHDGQTRQLANVEVSNTSSLIDFSDRLGLYILLTKKRPMMVKNFNMGESCNKKIP